MPDIRDRPVQKYKKQKRISQRALFILQRAENVVGRMGNDLLLPDGLVARVKRRGTEMGVAVFSGQNSHNFSLTYVTLKKRLEKINCILGEHSHGVN